MKPINAKQIDEAGDGSDGDTSQGAENNPLNPTGGGVPGTPKQAPDGD